VTPRAIYLSAGEPSGDRYASLLAAALRTALPDAELEGMGGPAMRAAGVRILETADHLGAMGLAEAASSAVTHLSALRRVRRQLSARRYDLAVLVDYPGFHLRVARAAQLAGIPVLYYIPPQLWAWGAWRAIPLRRAVRRLAVVLPFEEAYFRSRGMDARFVGHPLLDCGVPTRADARVRLGIEPDRPALGLFPGSRPGERRALWPVFREAARLLHAEHPDLAVLLACGPRGEREDADDLRLVHGEADTVAAAADAGLCKSGSTTLEAALADLPHVVAYRMHPITFAIATRVVRVAHVGLVNLMLGRRAIPELLQHAAHPRALADTVRPLLDRDGPAARAQRAAFVETREHLGSPGVAQRVAALGLDLVA
jgi:lipid-A-disaccharide synthase